MKKFLISTTLGFCLLWLVVPIEYLIKFTSDDSYFYLKTALNFSKGAGSTFDEINLTNGYHPLWFFFSTVVFKLSNLAGINSEESLLRIIFIATSIINYFSLIILIKFIKKYFNDYSLKNLIAFVVFLIPLVFYYLIGMEVQIFLFTLILFFYYFSKWFFDKSNKQKIPLIISISLSLLFLSRVDVFWYLIFFISLFIFIYNKNLIFNWLRILIIPFLTFLIYLIINKTYFDVYYPISSYYKLSWDIKNNLHFFPLPMKNPIDFLFLTLILLLFITSLPKIKKIHQDKSLAFLFFTNVSFLVFLLINFLVNKQGVREWYYTYPLFTSCVLFYFLFESKKFGELLLLIGLIFNLLYFIIFRTNYYNHNSAYEFARKLKQVTKETDRIFQVDYSGLVSYFSSRRVINGDGLINSYDYFKTVRSGELKNYLDAVNPDYLAFYSFTNPVKNDSVRYSFQVFHNYEFVIPKKNIVLVNPFIYGGIFRRKVGNFYLVRMNEYKLTAK
jgi:hypothetical protein